MYKGKITDDERYVMYSHFSKPSLIRQIFSNIENSKINRKVFDEIHTNYIKQVSELKTEIDNLKEFIDLLKEEINEYTKDKVFKKEIIDKKTYIIKDCNTGLYKIGISNQPLKREKTLQSEKPNIKIIKIFDKNIEKELHIKYKDFRLRGEWFILNNIQIKYICTHY
ncbi:Meiotically up-regulated gene 113 [uncultured Caudovirales phage]|uniref:Meiotically up-regulated gene 113 n=1 Tax=uncultured Caudovirales phage TaxID=2100421 RepID=A0A6J7X9Z5_9CAUD|nr:Meiotically up-regulated gene 113 [uncultured Caudovirales phage]